jgi:hypothetical protein
MLLSVQMLSVHSRSSRSAVVSVWLVNRQFCVRCNMGERMKQLFFVLLIVSIGNYLHIMTSRIIVSSSRSVGIFSWWLYGLEDSRTTSNPQDLCKTEMCRRCTSFMVALNKTSSSYASVLTLKKKIIQHHWECIYLFYFAANSTCTVYGTNWQKCKKS